MAGICAGTKSQEPDARLIARLVKQLGDDSFANREDASKELGKIGEPAVAALRTAVVSSGDFEVRRRAEAILQVIAARRLAIAAKKELDGLQGLWHSTSIEINGAPHSGENKADRHLFSGDQWTCTDGDSVVQEATVEIVTVGDTQVKVNFIITRGSRTGDTWVGIYERSGDVLKWCGGFAGEGRTRPSSLATKPGDGYFLRSLRRERK